MESLMFLGYESSAWYSQLLKYLFTTATVFGKQKRQAGNSLGTHIIPVKSAKYLSPYGILHFVAEAGIELASYQLLYSAV